MSEYAFFKKLREDATHKLCYRSSSNQDNTQSKNFRGSDFSRDRFKERTDFVENRRRDFGSLLSKKNVTRENFASFLLPLEVDIKKTGTILYDTYSLQEGRNKYWHHNGHGDIFLQKRQKLCQWVSDTSFPEIEDLCSKGYDFVSVLLNRLFPEKNENKTFEVLKRAQVVADGKSKLSTSCESDFHVKYSHMPARNLMELEGGPSLDGGLQSYLLEAPGDRMLSVSNYPCFHSCKPYLDNRKRMLDSELGSHKPCLDNRLGVFNSELGSNKPYLDNRIRVLDSELGSHEPYIDNRIRVLDTEIGERTTQLLCKKGGSTFGYHVENYAPPMLNYIRELDEFHYSNMSLCERQPQAQLLGFDDMKTDERNLSFACQNSQLSLCTPSSSSWVNGQQKTLDNRFSGSGFCKPALLSFQYPNPPSPRCLSSDDFRGCLLGVRDDIVPILDKKALSHMDNLMNLAKYSNCDTACKGSGTFHSPENDLCFMTKIVNGEHHYPEALFSPGLDFDLAQNCLPIKTSSRDQYYSTYRAFECLEAERTCSHHRVEDMYDNSLGMASCTGTISHFLEDIDNIHDWPSFYFQISFDKVKARSLLLDNSSGAECEGETYSSDGEVENF